MCEHRSSLTVPEALEIEDDAAVDEKGGAVDRRRASPAAPASGAVTAEAPRVEGDPPFVDNLSGPVQQERMEGPVAIADDEGVAWADRRRVAHGEFRRQRGGRGELGAGSAV